MTSCLANQNALISGLVFLFCLYQAYAPISMGDFLANSEVWNVHSAVPASACFMFNDSKASSNLTHFVALKKIGKQMPQNYKKYYY